MEQEVSYPEIYGEGGRLQDSGDFIVTHYAARDDSGLPWPTAGKGAPNSEADPRDGTILHVCSIVYVRTGALGEK